jgi:hypothetical protein
VTEHTTRAHSRFGGSGASRWMSCAGSAALIATVPAPPSGRAAMEGTAAHALAEECLREGFVYAQILVGQKFPREAPPEQQFEATMEMIHAVNVYLAAVRAEMDAGWKEWADAGKPKGGEPVLQIEQRFELKVDTADAGEVFGANDALVYRPLAKKLTVFDYKHGAGVAVSAEDNAQLKFYAAGAAFARDDWAVAAVELVIVQPRAFSGDGDGVKRWAMDPVDLLDFLAAVETAVALAKQAEAQSATMGLGVLNDWALKSGAHCRWCPAAGICPAQERAALEAAGLDFNDVTEITVAALPEPTALDNARLAKVLAAIDIFNAWGEQVRAHVDSLLRAGQDVPGFKLVEKQARRKWIDNEEDIAAFLEMMHGVDGDLLRPRRLVTITEAERLLKAQLNDAKAFKDAKDDLTLRFTIKESSGTTVAPASDKREAVNAVAADFASVNV